MRAFSNIKTMDKFNININFNNKCNQNCTYCFRDKTDVYSIDKNTLYTKIRKLVDSYPQDYITFFTIGIMSEIMMSKKEVLDFLHDIPYFMRYFFTEDDFNNIDEFLKEIDVKSLADLNKALSTKSFFNFLSSNIDLSNDEYYSEVLNTYKGEKWNIIWLNNYILRKLYPDYFKSRVPSYCSVLYFTNGTDLDKNFYEEIKKYYWPNEPEAVRVALSIDGPEDLHDKLRGKGTYKKVMETYNYLKEDFGLALNHIGATITSEIDDYYEYFKYFYDTFGSNSTILFSYIRDNPKYWYNKDTIGILLEKLDKYYDRVEQDLTNHENLDLFKFYLSNRFLNIITLLQKPSSIHFRCEIEKQFYIDGKGTVTNCFNNNFRINLTKDDRIIQDDPISYMEHLDVDRLEFCKNCDIRNTICGGPCYANLVKDKDYTEIECIIMRYMYKRCKRLKKIIDKENLKFD